MLKEDRKIEKELEESAVDFTRIKFVNASRGQVGTELTNYSKAILKFQRRLKELERAEKIISSVFTPKITITEVTNASGERIFIGKYRLYIETKPQLVTIYIGKANAFEGKDDPKLLSQAADKAMESTKKRLMAKNIDITADYLDITNLL